MKDDEDKKKSPAQQILDTMDPAARSRLLFTYKVVVTGALLVVVAITHKYGLGPGLIAAALYTLVF